MTSPPLAPPLGRYLTDDELKGCDLRSTDVIREYLNLTLNVFRGLGFLVMSRREDGTLQCKWLSFPCFYSVLLLSTHFYFIYIAALERYKLMNELTERSFDEDLFLYSLYAFYLLEGLAIAFIVQSKKVIAFYNSLTVFQARYYHAKGAKLDLRLRNHHKYALLLMSVVFFGVLFLANIINLQSVYKKLDHYGLQRMIENLISCAYVIADAVGLHCLFVTNVLYLQRVAGVIADDIIDAFRTGNVDSVDDYEKLWIDFLYIVKDFGDAFTYSVGYYLVLSTLLVTFELYLAIQQDHAVLSLYCAALGMSMMAIIGFVDRLINKLSHQLKDELLDVKKSATGMRRLRIDRFFKCIRSFDCEVSLKGFTVVNNRLASSVLNSVTTYIIILVQFNQINKQKQNHR